MAASFLLSTCRLPVQLPSPSRILPALPAAWGGGQRGGEHPSVRGSLLLVQGWALCFQS